MSEVNKRFKSSVDSAVEHCLKERGEYGLGLWRGQLSGLLWAATHLRGFDSVEALYAQAAMEHLNTKESSEGNSNDGRAII